jgi:hypothetical protein
MNGMDLILDKRRIYNTHNKQRIFKYVNLNIVRVASRKRTFDQYCAWLHVQWGFWAGGHVASRPSVFG